MKETELNKVLNYMKQYVENKYEHDSEPMLTYKDLQLVLEEIEKLHSIIKEAREFISNHFIADDGAICKELEKRYCEINYSFIDELLEILDKENK